MSEAKNEYYPAPGSAPEYVIATVGDFLEVPKDRQADCLAEFADFLKMARGIVELAEIAGEIMEGNAAAQIGPFTWIDDGKKNRTIRIHAPNATGERRVSRPLDPIVGSSGGTE